MGGIDALLAILGGVGGGAEGAQSYARWKAEQDRMAAEMEATRAYREATLSNERARIGIEQQGADRLRDQLAFQKQEAEDRTREEGANRFIKAGQEAGVGYLNPDLAYAQSQMANGPLGPSPNNMISPEAGAVSYALRAAQQASQNNVKALQTNFEPAQLRARNVQAPVMIPGTSGMGGVTASPKTFSPFSYLSAGIRAGATGDRTRLQASAQISQAAKQAAAAAISAMKPNLDAIFSDPNAQKNAWETIKRVANNAAVTKHAELVGYGLLPDEPYAGLQLSDQDISDLVSASGYPGKSPAPGAVAPVAPPAGGKQPATAPLGGGDRARAQRALQLLDKAKGLH